MKGGLMREGKIVFPLLCIVLIASLVFSQPADTEVEEDSVADSIRIIKVEDEDIDIGPIHVDVDDEDDAEWVLIGEDLTITAQDTVPDDAVAILSDLTVIGHVVGDAICISGDLILSGSVEGDVVSVGGSVEVESTAVIDGDLVCVGGTLTKMQGATVGGEVVNVPMPFIRPILHHALKYAGKGEKKTIIINPRPLGGFGRRIATFFLYLVKLVALIVFIFLILLFFKGGVERVADAIANHFWKAALAGFIGIILFLPITLLLIVFIIGIPLVPLFWIAVIAGMIFGFACITYTIGKIAAKKKGWKDKSPYILALIGLVVVEIVAFLGNLAMLPGGPFIAIGGAIKVIGFIISYLAWMVGFGGVILTRFGSRPFGNGSK
jgi:hypothetical protein